MEISLFAKKRTTKEGKGFYVYLSTLPKKDGSMIGCNVRFKDGCTVPDAKDCPMNICIEKEHCNLSQRSYEREDTGEQTIAYTLWVGAWSQGSAYVDHSLDDIDF